MNDPELPQSDVKEAEATQAQARDLVALIPTYNGCAGRDPKRTRIPER
jgi:hypothetical protein